MLELPSKVVVRGHELLTVATPRSIAVDEHVSALVFHGLRIRAADQGVDRAHIVDGQWLALYPGLGLTLFEVRHPVDEILGLQALEMVFRFQSIPSHGLES